VTQNHTSIVADVVTLS